MAFVKLRAAMRRENSINDARTEELRFCTRFFAGRVSACTHFLGLVTHDLFVNIDIFRVFNDRFISILERTARRYAKPSRPGDEPPSVEEASLAMTCRCHRELISDTVNTQTFIDVTEHIILVKLLHITSLEQHRVVRRCCVYESIFRIALIECFSDDEWRRSMVTMYDLRCALPSDLLNSLIAAFLVLGDQPRFWRTFFPSGDATMMAFLRQRSSSLVPLVVDTIRWYTLIQSEQFDEELRVAAEAKAAMAAMSTNASTDMPPPKAKRAKPTKRVEFTADTNDHSDSDEDDPANEAFSAEFSVGEEDSYAHRHNEKLLVALYEHNYEIAEADSLDTYEVTLALYALAEWLSHATPCGQSARHFYTAIHEALTIRRYEHVVVDYESPSAPAQFEATVVTVALAVAQWLLDQSSGDKQRHLETLHRFTCDAMTFDALVLFTEPLAWYERVRLLFAVTLNDVVTRRVRTNVNAHLQMNGSSRISASRRDLFQHRTSAFRGRFKISQSSAFNDEVVSIDCPDDDNSSIPDGVNDISLFSQHAALRLLRHARTVLQRDGDEVPRWLERVAVDATLDEATEWDRLYHFMYFDRNTMDPLELALSLEHLHRVYSVFSAPIQRSLADIPSDMQPFSARESSTPSNNSNTTHEQHQHSRRYFSSHTYLPATLLSTNKYIFLVLYRQHSQVIQRGLVPYLTLHNRFVVQQHVPIYPHLVQSYLHISANNNSSVLGGADTLVWTMRTLTHFYMTSATRFTLVTGALSNTYTSEQYTRHYQRLHRLLAAFAPTRQHIFHLLTQPYRNVETAIGNKQRGVFGHMNLTQRFTPAHELDGFGSAATNFYTAFTAFVRPELAHMMSHDTIQRICAGQDAAFRRLFHERHPEAALVLDCMYVDGARAVTGGGRLRLNDYFTIVPMHGMTLCDEIGRRGSELLERVLAEVDDPLGALYEACCDAELFGDFTLNMFLSIRLFTNITFPSCKCHHVKKLRKLARQNYKLATTAVYASEANANTYLPVIDGAMAKTKAHRTLDIAPHVLDVLQYLFMALETLYYFPARVSYSELAAASIEDPLERDKTFAELSISRMRELTEQMRRMTRDSASQEDRELAKACTVEARVLRGDFADYLMQLGFEDVMKAPEAAKTPVTPPLAPIETPTKSRNDACSHKRRQKSYPLLDAYTDTKKALSATSSLFASFAATPVEERSRNASVLGTGGVATPTATTMGGSDSPLHFTITAADGLSLPPQQPQPQSQPLTQSLLDSVFQQHGFGSDSTVVCKHTTQAPGEPVFRGRLDEIEEWITLERFDRRPLCNYPVWAQGADFATQNEVFPVWFNLMGVNGARRAHTIDTSSGLSMPFDGCNQDFLATLLMRPLTVVAVEPLAPLYARHFAREPLRLHAFTFAWRRRNAERRVCQHGLAVSESERVAEKQRVRINAHLMAAQRWVVK